MNFNFHEFRKPRRQRLFIPLSVFSFAGFVVPIKFRQPVFASLTASSGSRRVGFNRGRRLDGQGN
jgi:hypothetical protein